MAHLRNQTPLFLGKALRANSTARSNLYLKKSRSCFAASMALNGAGTFKRGRLLAPAAET
jgi:hypothetical protein